MEKVSLQELLDSTSTLSNGMKVCSSLMQDMEVIGYVNSCTDDNVISDLKWYSSQVQLNTIVNHSNQSQIVCSNHLYQILPSPNGKELKYQGFLSPIYPKIVLSEKEWNINVESLHIPSLRSNMLYFKIKARFGTGVTVNRRMLQQANFPDTITAEEGKAIYHIPMGAMLCMDKEGQIRGVGENILALCRYVLPSTGVVNYAQFELTELFITEDTKELKF